MRSTSIWRIITDGSAQDRKRPAAHASGGAVTRRRTAGAWTDPRRNRTASRGFAPDPARDHDGAGAGHARNGIAAGEALRQWSGVVARAAIALRPRKAQPG